MPRRANLATLLSQALVAFTIEFDNEAESRLPHSTTDYGRTPGALYAPWLVSMAMYFNCMQHLGEQGITLRELRRLARTETNLRGMHRWGYIYLAPDPADRRPKPPKADWLVRPKPGGLMAHKIWQPLFAEIEDRWKKRFGAAAVRDLRKALTAIATQLDPDLPDCLPIVGYGLASWCPVQKKSKSTKPEPLRPTLGVSTLPLPALLARVLYALAIEFEQNSPVSLALSANILRILDEKPTRLRDLPELTGVSTEMVAVSTGWLVRHKYAVLDAAPPPDRGKQIRLNEKGLLAQEAYGRLLLQIEKNWQQRFGAEAINHLRATLESLVEDGTADNSPLFAGLEPHPEGWRAKVRNPTTLPHFPMVTHRGGYPDGS
jgi:hypothetical protein